MTSVPKPLKFLRPHYNTLRAELEGIPSGAANRQPLADVVRGKALASGICRLNCSQNPANTSASTEASHT
jgi:hypothetical protein